MMRFEGPFSLETATEREWLLTNGLGGFASATVCGMHTRRYHGLLVAALRPPGQRVLLVAKLEERIVLDHAAVDLSTNQYPDTYHPTGYRYLDSVDLRDDAVVMRFTAGEASLEKRIAMVHGENTTRVRYRNTGSTAYTLELTPLVNARDFHGETRAGAISFGTEARPWAGGPAVRVHPAWMAEGYWLYADAGAWTAAAAWHGNMVYAWERRRGLHDIDNHFCPGHFRAVLAPGAEVVVVLSTLSPPGAGEASALDVGPSPAVSRPPPAGSPPEVARLYRTAESFLVQRASVNGDRCARGKTIIAGYHWFGDWGRDTMIALPGLCLLTGRHVEAADILRTFAAARRNGLLPNLFLDSGAGEAYNAVDASLWFVHAVQCYLEASGDTVLVEGLRPALEEIIGCYRAGTDFGIRMDDDGLIDASAPGWQLTWMDAKVGEWVVTPRMGKAVEINALWYHALRIMEAFAARCGWPGEYGALADRVRASFGKFWHAQGGYLYDVLGPSPDARVRPNQIFAVSLPHSPLGPAQARAVLDTVTRYLLTPYGLRSLAPHDHDYRGTYAGNVWERDGAYHQGTVWAWLIGPYVDAYLRVHGSTEAARAACRRILQPLLAHVRDAGVGSISEIFDGDPPHLPKGTVSQAWSVSEVLRAWDACRADRSRP